MKGLVRTKSDIVAEQIKDILEAKTLSEMFIKANEGTEKLKALNIFKHISMVLDTDKKGAGNLSNGIQGDGGGEGEDGQVDKMQVTFLVKESGWFKSTLGAEAGTQSGGAVSGMGMGL